jgi:integrase
MARRLQTRKNYAVTFNVFETLCRPTRLRSITERTISAFAAALRGSKGISGTAQASTVKVRLQFLHTALQCAEDQKLIAERPRFPAIKVPKRTPQPVAAESFEKMLDKAKIGDQPDQNMRGYILCGWLAGLRLNEALALEWEETDKAPWVDLQRNRIWLPAGFVKAVEDQWVPLDLELRQALLALPRHGRKVFRFVDKSARPVCDITVSARVVKLAKAAGVRLTMKSLRRGFGCRYAGKVPAQVLQKLMRHADIKVTMDYYANVDEAAEEAILGPKRNTSRNTGPVETSEQEEVSARSDYGTER